MTENPGVDRGAPTSERRHTVLVSSPRRLTGRTYALIGKRDGGERTIARHVTIAQALVIALEHRREHGAAMVCRDRGALREYVIGRRRPDGSAL